MDIVARQLPLLGSWKMTDLPIAEMQPVIGGPRVVLRPFRREDAAAVERLAGAREIADTTLRIPHPYPEGAAAAWIATHAPDWAAGKNVHFAIAFPCGELLGAIGLELAREQGWAELGYWVGLPYWNNGYCTEGGILVLKFAFADLGLHRVQARHLVRNPASGRVLEKLGMRREGIHREAVRKWGRFEDVASYATLASEWEREGRK